VKYRGDGVTVCQVEHKWLQTHEDLRENIRYEGSNGPVGTHAVGAAGVVVANRNGIGYNGIAANSFLIARSVYFSDQDANEGFGNIARAIQWCTDALKAGDVMMVIIQLSFDAEDGSGTVGIPVEYYPDHFDAVRAATDKGIIVVQPSGNENTDISDPSKSICV
jgi:subtilisin family serine protease